jgi:6-phosphogluconate dehydrogenase
MSSLSIGIVGLGRMGGNMAKRLARAGVRVAGYDATPGAADALGADGTIQPAASLHALVDGLATPRVVWLMVPAGAPTQASIDALAAVPRARRHDRRRRQRELQGLAAPRGGARRARHPLRRLRRLGRRVGPRAGLRADVRRAPEAARAVEPFARILAPGAERGWLHCGPPGRATSSR